MNRNNFLLFTKSSAFIFVGGQKRTHNMGFGVIGAGRCYLQHQQHGCSCSGRTNIGEHFILSCTSAKHQQRFRADVFQIPQQRQALLVTSYAVDNFRSVTVRQKLLCFIGKT